MGFASLFPEYAGSENEESIKAKSKVRKNAVPNDSYKLWAFYCSSLKEVAEFAAIEIPAKISGINAGCLKNLVKEYSFPTLRLMIKCVIMDWEAFREHFKIHSNFPELKLITYFREKISFAATSGAGFFTSTHRFSKYAQYFEELKNESS